VSIKFMSVFISVSYYIGLLCFGGGVYLVYRRVYYYGFSLVKFIEWEIYSMNSRSIIIVILID